MPPALACCVDSNPAPTLLPWDPPVSSSPEITKLPSTVPVWSLPESVDLYKIGSWGAPYFSANSSGNITIRPHGNVTLPHQELDLLKIVKKATDSKPEGGLGLQMPLIVRFPNVLENRLECLQSAFNFAIESLSYDNHYQGVYPVKCNQDRFIVEDIVKFGSGFRFGLEAGSKPELLLAMTSLCNGSPEALLVCNGFKDDEYISLALFARKLKINSVIVLEQVEELDSVITISQKLGIKPVIGVRAKLRTKHSGHFGSTSGEKGKFGLTTTQILRVVKKLSEVDMLDCLQLLHFHIGSQIPTTVLLADGVSEATQIYCELVRLGADMRVVDIGGGLGIDYDGSKSSDSDLSVSYTLDEYAYAVVESVRGVCDRKGVKHPVLCSESGRAIVSHHSVLVFEAVSASVYDSPEMNPVNLQFFAEGLSEEALVDYRNLLSAAAGRGEFENWAFYADRLKLKCVDQFKEGTFSMEQLAAVDGLCDLVSKAMGGSGLDPVHTYHVNLSVFTSVPDFWGIDQIFPIVPIHRLDEKPSKKGFLSDLTCDSDGKIDKFIGGGSSLPLHDIAGANGGYYLGMFLGGAYEEALGGVHNLFSGPSVVRVSQSDGPHGFAVTRAVPGPSCADVLRVMNHEPELMFETLKNRVEEFVHEEDINNGVITNGLAQTFQNMPYLVPNKSSCVEYYFSDDNGSVVDSSSGEDEPWATYCCA